MCRDTAIPLVKDVCRDTTIPLVRSRCRDTTISVLRINRESPGFAANLPERFLLSWHTFTVFYRFFILVFLIKLLYFK